MNISNGPHGSTSAWQLLRNCHLSIWLNHWWPNWFSDAGAFGAHWCLQSAENTSSICMFVVSSGDILNIQTECQSWRLTTRRAVFNILSRLIEPLTQIVIYLFQIGHMHRITITELVNIHHFCPKDYTSYLKWYSIKCDCRNTEWSVLAWIWLMLWRKKKHFIGIKIQVKITWGNSSYIPVPVPRPALYSPLLGD